MLNLLFLVIGLALVLLGANFLTDGASGLARRLHIPEIVIGLTIVSFGPSAPELAISLSSALQGSADMAAGNVIGSNIFNVLMILGLTGVIQPLEGITINYIDLGVLITAAILFWLFSFTKYKLERWEGAVLLALCAGYITWLIYSS